MLVRLCRVSIQILIAFTFLYSSDSLQIDTSSLPSLDIADSSINELTVYPDLNISPTPDEDIFDAQLAEAKTIFAEAIISDLTGDTLEAAYQFELLFESLSHIEELSSDDEFQTLEFNRILTAAIDYYEDESVTMGKVETGFSVAMFEG